MAVGAAIVEGIAVLYGCMLLSFACGYALLQPETWTGPSESERAQLKIISKQLWALGDDEASPLAHDFLALADGLQLHYLKTRPELRKRPARHLIIFLHGFPDSCHLFSRVLESSIAEDAQLVSLDLPGCGGSDSLPVYSADLVLNAVVEGLVLIRQQYLKDGMRCILVGHDWGGVIGYRIAADTHGLFDEMVTMNSVHAACVEADVTLRFTRAAHVWSTRTSLSSALKEIAAELGPVWSQLRKSHYTFLLQLKFGWLKALPSVASALLRYVHRSGSHKGMEVIPEASFVRCLSSSYGPSEAEITTSRDSKGRTYGSTVLDRARTSPPGDWDQRFKLYREGLILDPWTLAEAHSHHAAVTKKGLETPSDQGPPPVSGRLQVPASQRLQYPLTVLFGIDDEALDHRIVVDALEDFFMRPEDGPGYRPSRIIKMPDCGHWSPMTEVGTVTLIEELRTLTVA